MEDTLISFETAKLAKEKEFLEISNYPLWFNSNGVEASDFEDLWNVKKSEYFKHECILRPTQSLLQKWLREVHNIHIEVLPRYQPKKLNTEEVLYSWAISCKPFDKYDGHNDVLNHWIGIHNGAPYIEDIFYHVVKTHEEALEFGLQEALKLIK